MNTVPFDQLLPTHADLVHILEQLRIETIMRSSDGITIFYEYDAEPLNIPRNM